MSVEWITYKNQSILYVNFRGLKEPEAFDNLERACRTVASLPRNVLLLVNVENVMISRAFMERAKELCKKPSVEDSKIKKSTVVGIDPLKSVLLLGYNRDTNSRMKPFDTEEAAKEWLVEPVVEESRTTV